MSDAHSIDSTLSSIEKSVDRIRKLLAADSPEILIANERLQILQSCELLSGQISTRALEEAQEHFDNVLKKTGRKPIH